MGDFIPLKRNFTIIDMKAIIDKCHHHFPNTLHDAINDAFPHSVMTTGVVVGGVLLSRDQLLRVEKLFVPPDSHFI